jgi:hypothetical protein
MSPFLSWAAAATNLQDAVDAASPGDIVLVTNGLYATGGKAKDGVLTNRVALDKPITLLGVNGPTVTTIQGNWDPASTNGPLAIRCAWLTDGASLCGFTVENGATRSGFSPSSAVSGGGVWCSSSNALLVNCIVRCNAAAEVGSGVSQGTLDNCLLTGNIGSLSEGDAAYNAQLNNCTVVSNSVAGVLQCVLTNCIIYYNTFFNVLFSGSTLSCCCTTPMPSGPGNISAAPMFLPGGVSLAPSSPCRGAGTNPVTAADIFGQPWANPPSMGCEEFQPAPAVFGAPRIQLTGNPVGFAVSAYGVGQAPVTCWWLRNGVAIGNDSHFSSTGTTNLVATGISLSDAGTYQLVMSNAFGVVTSAVAQLAVHCVDAAGAGPVAPYVSWAAAATNIQDAIDVAGAGDVVLVTDGIYANGGKVMAGDLTNRVALAQPITLLSVNGPATTVIQGAWDPVSTNGPLAVRCAWLTNGATVGGFTLQGGATRNSGDTATLQSGGGVWGPTSNAVVVNCVICSNAASYAGGGCYQAPLERCRVLGNSAGQSGGGVFEAPLHSCQVQANSAYSGGGACGGWLTNCTVVENSAVASGGGISGSGGFGYAVTFAVNCIVTDNSVSFPFGTGADLAGFVSVWCSCLSPYDVGLLYARNDIYASTGLLDGVHLATTSPCRGAGNAAYASGTDLDGDPWANPPSMGCEEVWESTLTGPLTIGTIGTLPAGNIAVAGIWAWLTVPVDGRLGELSWSFGDGAPAATNADYLDSSDNKNVVTMWSDPGDYTVTCTAYNTDNPGGVSTNAIIHVMPLAQPWLSIGAVDATHFSIGFTGQPGVSYLLWRATDLTPPVRWQQSSSLYSTGGVEQLIDNQAPGVGAFYRVEAE